MHSKSRFVRPSIALLTCVDRLHAVRLGHVSAGGQLGREAQIVAVRVPRHLLAEFATYGRRNKKDRLEMHLSRRVGDVDGR